RAWMIDSLVSASRSALRESPRRGASGMRAYLLATTAAAALLAGMPAYAQDATWSQTPSSGDFNTAANWNTATVPTGTASFGRSNVTSLSFSANTTVGGFTFNAGAPAYTFTVPNPFSLTFNGAA